ncbi:MAG TPA: ABC transporter ATP-binding protein/permease [Casimicrobiaceae bacterium]|nr:ABC transporter ATP-binding protein/permease [Casimicrobiaceae bacterium]
MRDKPKYVANALPESDEVTASRLVPQVGAMLRAFWGAPVRNALLLLAAAIVLVVVATAYGQIRLNRWNQPFYDALSHRDLAEFILQLGVFGIIAGALLILNVAQRWLTEMLKLKLREGLTRDLIENWMHPRRAFRLASAGPIGINPDQRMHEDARHLTELSADLGIGLLQASILLVVFVKVLWVLSADFVFHLSGRSVAIPGYMVWAGVLYAGSASLLSYWVGRNLIGRNAERYAREAELRFALVRVNEHIDAIALAGGEAGEARRLELDLSSVLAAMRRLVTGLTNLTWITAGYGWVTVVAPILVAAPLYFTGSLSFGGLMMAAAAFTQVQASLRWFVDNFSTIADWRATLLRVANFRYALMHTDVLHGITSHIVFEQGAPGKMTIEGLEIASPAGCTMLQESRVEVRAGERVLIVGEPGVGKTLLFRALAGLWPWGAGRIAWPKGEAFAYVPREPYLPPGTLSEVLAYPLKVEDFTAQAFADALERLGLRRLVPMLASPARWDLELSDDEQQSVVFARLLIHPPRWVLIDEVLESLEEETRRRALEIIFKELKEAAVIYIGRTKKTSDPVFARVLHLVKDPTMRRLVRQKAADVHAPAPAIQAAMS